MAVHLAPVTLMGLAKLVHDKYLEQGKTKFVFCTLKCGKAA